MQEENKMENYKHITQTSWQTNSSHINRN